LRKLVDIELWGFEKRVVLFSENLISMIVMSSDLSCEFDEVGISQEVGAFERKGICVVLEGLVMKIFEVLLFL
jgi:hypothetical protein